jgi:hypothetical protein
MFQQAAIVGLSRERSPLAFSVARANVAGNGSLAAAARERLRASAYREVRAVWCECQADVLVLRGQVSSFYLKQVAQESVKHLAGVQSLINCVKVVRAIDELCACRSSS